MVAMNFDHLLQLVLAAEVAQNHRVTQPQSLLHLRGASGAAARLHSFSTLLRCNGVAGLAFRPLSGKLSCRKLPPTASQPDRKAQQVCGKL